MRASGTDLPVLKQRKTTKFSTNHKWNSNIFYQKKDRKPVMVLSVQILFKQKGLLVPFLPVAYKPYCLNCIFFISICTYPYNSSGYHVDTYYHYQLHISNVIMQIVILQNLNVRCTIWFIYVSSSHHSKSFLKKVLWWGLFFQNEIDDWAGFGGRWAL